MKENNWILLDDVKTLTKEQYEAFVSYSKFMGVNCRISYSELHVVDDDLDILVVYDSDDELVWLFSWGYEDTNDQLSLEEIIRYSKLAMI